MISLLFATAEAADPGFQKDWSLDTFVATTTVSDRAWRTFSDNEAMPAYGFRLGWRPVPRVSLDVGWGAVRRGASVDVGDFSGPSVAAATAHQVTLGGRVDASIADTLLPSLAVNGVVLPMSWRFDSAPDVKDDPTQVRVSGLPLGVELLAGAELRIPPQELVALAGWLQLGGAVYTRATFGDVGTLRPGGFVARGGIGLRF